VLRIIKYVLINIILIYGFNCLAKQNISLTTHHKINDYLKSVMQNHGIPGMAVAIVVDGEVAYNASFGQSSLELEKSVDSDTIFRIFSATKLITATAVFQLVEQGKINLKDKLPLFFDGLPNQWQGVKIENLLTHSSGLPDLLKFKYSLSDEELFKKLYDEKMDFTTGDQFRYNQTNYWLLALIIKKVTGLTFVEYVYSQQFNATTNGVLFSSNSLLLTPNRAVRYYYDFKERKHVRDRNNSGVRGYSGNGFNVSLNEWIAWNKRLDNNQLLNKESKNKMWSGFDYTNKADDFGYGWGHYPVSSYDSWGFTGGNLAAFRKFINEDVTIIFLSNGYTYPAHDIVINDLAKMIIPELKNKKLIRQEDIWRQVFDAEYEKAKASYVQLKIENPKTAFDNLKWNINSLGNRYIREKKPEEALHVFKFNVQTNPGWWVAIAGLAEIYEVQGLFDQALGNYKKAIELNLNNEWDYNKQMHDKVNELSLKQQNLNYHAHGIKALI